MSGTPWRSTRPMAVLGSGHAVPGEPVATADLIALMERRFGFARGREAAVLAQRMRIDHRHLCRDFAAAAETARPGATNADLAARAITRALGDAGLSARDIGYIIGHTTTPCQTLPPGTAFVADRLGYHGPHVELRQACTGFANALMIAHGLLAAEDAAPVVIVGSETGSLFFDPARMGEEPGQIVNMIQMGDGAGAVVLGPAARRGARLEASWFGAVGVGRQPGIQMHHGATEFAHDFGAIAATGSILFDAGHAAAQASGFALADADHIVPHQVSGRIGDQAAAHLRVARERVFVSADRLGNTGSAAIWIALAQLRAAGLEAGETILTLGAEASKFMYGGFVYRHG